MLAIALLLVGVVLLLATVYNGLGIILIIVGLVLLLVYPVGPGPYYGRRR